MREQRRSDSRQRAQQEVFALLEQWCDGLLEHQIPAQAGPRLAGGFLCPACARVHGRSADAVYPLLYMAERTGQDRYRQAAEAVYEWSEQVSSRSDGSYFNDTNATWQGITVFSVIAQGEALLYRGQALSVGTRARWQARMAKALDFLHGYIDAAQANINYPITCAAAMAVGWRVLGRERDGRKARELARRAIGYLTDEGLIFGEGKPNDLVTPKGYRAVDLGYNVEESLGALATYGLLMGDDAVLRETERAMRGHLPFLLPDGGWDNSWGSRSAKWTYWGSRTSDGCQIAYGLLAGRDPLFAEAAWRNFESYRACTQGKLLHGGPMYAPAGQAPCIHHTFCHAKALAAWLDHGVSPRPGLALPRETQRGWRQMPSVGVGLITQGPWTATLSDYDYDPQLHPTAGLTLLWHRDAGPLVAATMPEYQLVEPNNMQLPDPLDNICQTPRAEVDGARSDLDDRARWTPMDEHTAEVNGRVGPWALWTRITLDPEAVSIQVRCEGTGRYRLPLIVPHGGTVAIVAGELTVTRADGATIRLHASAPLAVDPAMPERVFHPVGGFETLHLLMPLTAGEILQIAIHIG